MAPAILGMPVGKVSTAMVREILKRGRVRCAPQPGFRSQADIRSIRPNRSTRLAVIGICRTQDIRRNASAEPGDVLILTKALGVGIYSAAFKKGALSPAAYAETIASTTLLNRVGTELVKDSAAHSMTDVTGFGLLGHAHEMARGSRHLRSRRLGAAAHTGATDPRSMR